MVVPSFQDYVVGVDEKLLAILITIRIFDLIIENRSGSSRIFA